MNTRTSARRRAPLLIAALGLYGAVASAGLARALRHAPLVPSQGPAGAVLSFGRAAACG